MGSPPGLEVGHLPYKLPHPAAVLLILECSINIDALQIESALVGGAGSGDLQPQAFTTNTPRTQSLINNQQRQLLHKLFSKGSLPSQQQMLSDTAEQNMYYQQQQQQPQSGYGAQLQHSQQYMPQQQLQQQHMHVGAGGQNMAGPFKPGRPDQQAQQQQQQQLQQPMYHITAQAYDSVNYAQQQFGGGQIHPLAQHQGVLTRGQSFALNGQLGMMTRGQSFNNGQQGMLTRGQSFANGQSSGEQAMEGMIESPRLEVLVTPNFTSQELNMLLEVSRLCCEILEAFSSGPGNDALNAPQSMYHASPITLLVCGLLLNMVELTQHLSHKHVNTVRWQIKQWFECAGSGKRGDDRHGWECSFAAFVITGIVYVVEFASQTECCPVPSCFTVH